MIRSPRLTYRRLSAEDAAAFHALCLDDHLRQYLLDGEAMPRSWADECVAASDRLFDQHGVGLWLLHVDDGTPIGFTGFHRFDALSEEPQLLYALATPFVGRGFASEAAAAVLDAARHFPRVVAAVDAPNVASKRVLDKLGFCIAGRVPGAFGDTLLYERYAAEAPPRIDAPVGARWQLRIASTWDGEAARDDEIATLDLTIEEDGLLLDLDAPFHGDPAPTSSERLWEHEVVELMLLGENQRYLEVELSPHGHALVLMLAGERNIVHRDLAMHHHAAIDGARWRSRAHIPRLWLPEHTRRINAFSMHGERRHLAWKSPGGALPDFHRLEAFGDLDDVRA